jgi:hypothetical protein
VPPIDAYAARAPSLDAVSLGPRRTFLICVAVSLALHVVVLVGLPGIGFVDEAVPPPLSAELQRVEPPPPPPPPAAKPAPKPVPPRPHPSAPAPPPPASTPPVLAAPPAQVAETAPAPEPAPAAETPPAAAAEPAQPPAADPPPPEPAAADAAPEQPPPLPASGSVRYELYYGGGVIGRSVQTWRIDASSYRLTSSAETIGLVSVFLPYQFAYVSEGKVGPDGLRPDSFSARRGRAGSRQSMAKFDWAKHEITLGPLGTPRTQALPDGTQDLLSFIYQMARTTIAPGRRTVVLTTGSKVDTYVLDVGAEEPLELPVGQMYAVPVRQIAAPGEERMEIWLAAAPPRVPVRIRFYDRAGNMTIEQLASKIDTDGT